jgi:hypothetical protein
MSLLRAAVVLLALLPRGVNAWCSDHPTIAVEFSRSEFVLVGIVASESNVDREPNGIGERIIRSRINRRSGADRSTELISSARTVRVDFLWRLVSDTFCSLGARSLKRSLALSTLSPTAATRVTYRNLNMCSAKHSVLPNSLPPNLSLNRTPRRRR